MQTFNVRKYTLCGLAIASVLAAAQAQAQAQLEEIVVTAQRTESTLQRTPISVTAYDSTALEQRGVANLMDLSISTPNLSVGARAGAAGTRGSFAIRGMGINAEDSSAAVGVYLDDVYSPSLWGNILGLLDTERVEVLRGPQGTLFGRNTIAGAVQYVSVKPKKEFEAYIEGTGGNLDRRALKAAINLPLADTLSARLSVLSDRLGGFVTDDFNNVDRGEVKNTLGRLQLRWTPVEDLTIDLKVEDARQRTNGRGVAIVGVNPLARFVLAAGATQFLPPPAPPGSFTTTVTPAYISTREYHFAGYSAPDYFNSDGNIYGATIAYDLTDSLTLKSISAYTENKNKSVTDLDMTPLSIIAGSRGLVVDKVFSEELQLTGRSLNDRLTWAAGLYYYDSETKKTGQNIDIGPPGIFNLKQSNTLDEVTSKALYVQATYGLTDQFSITGGLRYTDEDVRTNNLGGSTFPPPPPLTFPYSRSANFTDTSPHLGLNYQATDTAMFYVKGSKGFRAGGFALNENIPAEGSSPAGATVFDPETAWTYEAGARLEFMNRRLRFNPTVFFTDWKDIQFNQLRVFPLVGTIITTRNAGDAEIKGLEIETQFAATDRLLLTASGSYLDAHYTRVGSILLQVFPFGPTDLVQNLGIDDPLQQSPKYKFSLGGRHTQPVASGQLVTSLDYGWTDKQRSAVTRSDGINIPAYGLLNGRILYAPNDSKWSVAFYGTNLLNKYYLMAAAASRRALRLASTKRISAGRASTVQRSLQLLTRNGLDRKAPAMLMRPRGLAHSGMGESSGSVL